MLYYTGDSNAIRQCVERGVAFLRENSLKNLREISNDDGTVTLKAKAADSFLFITKPSVTIDPHTRDVVSYTCDCPEAKKGLCVHCAALILSVGEQLCSRSEQHESSVPSAFENPEPIVRLSSAVPETITPPAASEKPQPANPGAQTDFVPPGIKVQLGIYDRSDEAVLWTPNDTERILHSNIGIIGTMGTGKTQMTKSVVCQLIRDKNANYGSRRLGVLIFDYKGDYNETKQDFVDAVDARILKPYRLPFNPLALVEPKTFTPLLPVHTANALITTLSKIFPLGPKQQRFLRDCIMEAYRERGIDPETPETWKKYPPTFENVYRIYSEKAGDKTPDSLDAVMEKIHLFRLFDDRPAAVGSIRDLMDGVVVIDLSGYDPDIQSTVAAITLDQFYAQMLSMGSSMTDGRFRELREMILVDEADNLMKEDFPSLRKILKEGREFGVCMLLSTQSLSHFVSGSDNYSRYILTWVVHAVSDLKQKDIEYVFKLPPRSRETKAVYSGVKNLKKHCSMLKIADDQPTVLRDLPFWQLVRTL